MNQVLENTAQYLTAFFGSKYQNYMEGMKELRPNNGYGKYYKHHEVTQSIRDIVLNINDHFSDIRIPEKLSSPRALVQLLENYYALLNRNNELYQTVFEYYNNKSAEAPEPVAFAYEINNEVKSAIEHVFTFDEIKPFREGAYENDDSASGKLQCLMKILNKFGEVARQLVKRRIESGIPRNTLKIKDEYDCQDLLHALLKIDFEDIRPEEWVPSYAGKSSRTDFLLKTEQIIIEVKKTRDNLADKEVGEELILDIAKYNGHPDAKTLVCFVYDPDQKISNPNGLIHDLQKLSRPELNVKIVVGR